MMSPQCMERAVDEGRAVVPDHEVCAFCGDPECDGIGCIASLDPNDTADQPRIEELHDLIRAGRAWTLATAVLADAEGRYCSTLNERPDRLGSHEEAPPT